MRKSVVTERSLLHKTGNQDLPIGFSDTTVLRATSYTKHQTSTCMFHLAAALATVPPPPALDICDVNWLNPIERHTAGDFLDEQVPFGIALDVHVLGSVYTGTLSAKLLLFRGVKKTHTPLNNKSFTDEKHRCEQRFVGRSTLLLTKPPPLMGGGGFLSAGERSPADKQQLHCAPFSGTAVVAQSCR
ncbi:hypothetical protein UY3_19202 [Chelonia mydas]|uniref:Uncharacterized protein n=1 Tax=Chelonia mydas TaxID=8469 RepID=M7AM43_CHEMY|nr:hypothetical protein UY3_19202 [Chelonia mydas]